MLFKKQPNRKRDFEKSETITFFDSPTPSFQPLRAGITKILDPNILETDAEVSNASIDQLKQYIVEPDRSLVFFVGAGASMAGSTGMPSTPSLIYQLLWDSLVFSGAFDSEAETYERALGEISPVLGFEITLNDFWQICHEATASIYTSFAELEGKCTPNQVHAFLAHWLATKGTVVTTNYDRLIEREWEKISRSTKSLFGEHAPNPYATWREDLQHGACLFKLPGSLDDPQSCLGALEHVGTQLTGSRAELLTEIVINRPLCFVGWRGVDPDIPTLLNKAFERRNRSLPVFWIHYEGSPPGSITLDDSIQNMPLLIKPLASQHPIITEADRAFGEMLNWVGVEREPNRFREPLSFDFREPISQCAKTGVTRMVGIALRRGGKLKEAERVLSAALSLAETSEERSAALQEISLVHQQIGGRKTGKSRKYLSRARKVLGDLPDPWLQLNTDFGSLSQTIVALKNQPWLVVRVPFLFLRYRRDINSFRETTTDHESAALHKSLYYLYMGRFRFKLWGWFARLICPLRGRIMEPFDIARSTIGYAKDIHIHSRIDVMAYRALALAYLGNCEATEDLLEIDRIVAVLNDNARTKHWESQRREIVESCKE